MSFELKSAAAVVLLAAASWSVTAHAATQSTSTASLFPDANAVDVSLAPVAALQNSPVHFYLTGYVGGYARCNDLDGCDAFSIQTSISLSFSSASGLSYFADVQTGVIDYAASEYGDFIDFTPVKFSTPVRTFTYDEALSFGLINTDGTQPAVQGRLRLNASSVGFPNGGLQYDILDVAALTPKINLHYVANPNPITSQVPEPSTAMLGLLGLAALAGARRYGARRG